MKETFELITNFIKDVGFPVFVACYLLIRLEPTLKRIGEINAQLLCYLQKKNGER